MQQIFTSPPSILWSGNSHSSGRFWMGDLGKGILTALVETSTQIRWYQSFHIQQNPVFSVYGNITMSKT